MAYINIAEPFMGQEEFEALSNPIKSGWLTQGPLVKKFEEAFAARHSSANALAVTSGTTALHLAYLASGVGPGDIVIVPSFTWVATANAVEYCGAQPIFCDNSLSTYNLDIDSLEKQINSVIDSGKKVKALVPVHLFGLISDMDQIMELSLKYDFSVIEDAACAVGASYKGRSVGTIGKVACFSFHPRKIITTGEGGMCLTSDTAVAEAIGRLRNHGASPSAAQSAGGGPYLMADFNELGYNFRMTDLQAAIGFTQLQRLDDLISQRRHLASLYGEALKDIDWLKTPVTPEGSSHSWQAYVCLIDDERQKIKRDDIMKILHENGIGSRAGTHAIHELGYYQRKYGLSSGDFPNAARLYAQTISLPLHNNMTEDDLGRVIDCLKTIPRSER